MRRTYQVVPVTPNAIASVAAAIRSVSSASSWRGDALSRKTRLTPGLPPSVDYIPPPLIEPPPIEPPLFIIPEPLRRIFFFRPIIDDLPFDIPMDLLLMPMDPSFDICADAMDGTKTDATVTIAIILPMRSILLSFCCRNR